MFCNDLAGLAFDDHGFLSGSEDDHGFVFVFTADGEVFEVAGPAVGQRPGFPDAVVSGPPRFSGGRDLGFGWWKFAVGGGCRWFGTRPGVC